MKKMRLFLILILLFSMSSNFTFAQDLRIFGFFQTFYRNAYQQETNLFEKFGVPVNSTNGIHTYGMQQFNLMASSNFGSGFSAFVNLEMTNNTDVNRMFGNFAVQEAFVKWTCPSGLINVKFGTFLPKFNSFLEVYNRFPLIPYLNRPIVYDPGYYSYFNPDDFFPFKANFQVYGDIDLNDEYAISWAIYHANPELSYLNTASGANAGAGGYNQTTKMTAGGRLGVKALTETFSFDFGASMAMDHDRQDAYNAGVNPQTGEPIIMDLGHLPRTKFGVDAMFSVFDFTLKGELIQVTEDTDDVQAMVDALPVDDFDKVFYYGSLEYAFLDRYTVYGMYGNLEDHANILLSAGLSQYSFGATYKPVDNIALKAQWHMFKMNDNKFGVELDIAQIFLGASVMF